MPEEASSGKKEKTEPNVTTTPVTTTPTEEVKWPSKPLSIPQTALTNTSLNALTLPYSSSLSSPSTPSYMAAHLQKQAFQAGFIHRLVTIYYCVILFYII